ncbi:unnamed protein product [Hymenolepis diminuta]|uniref:coproporphyrinogen oxidase n=1 Tax=Hymenolepis diminuta TaxID=6216 RepID=A0A0R3SWP2_HYMDI|nr:unnamed protein product [Hymenolepis diminuta]
MLKGLSFGNDFKITDAPKWMAEPITSKDELLHSSDVRSKMEMLCMDLQSHLCRHMETIDGKARFVVDRWMRNDGNGGGISCVLQGGRVFEKAGINISVITSTLSENAIQQMKGRSKDLEGGRNYTFRVVGISSVNHPLNPHVPTMHFNFRYFEVTDMETGRVIWWFGGGCDLTPYFLYEEDVKSFHKLFRDACDVHDPSYYPRFKKWCDEYFFIKHRSTSRFLFNRFLEA